MSNKITRVMDALQAGQEELIASEVLMAVERDPIDGFTPVKTPLVTLSVSRMRRVDKKKWSVDVLMQIAMESVGPVREGALIEVIAHVIGKVDQVADSDGPGGTIESPMFDFWCIPGPNGVLKRIGAIGGMVITVADPLLD